ncbi:MAG TPA: hypothetical protein VFJ93_06320 [Gaiellaceae bacterium]|nr:hypothetical protein [Gaiellaceae bacterium]
MNLWRLHPVPFPDVSAHADDFEALIDVTPQGAAVEYTLDAPRWWFLHHLIRCGYVLHGSNNPRIDDFEPRGNYDAHNVRHVEGVFASDDAIWPIYFATADRTSEPRGLINWCEHTRTGARYLFALEGEPSWVDGAVYALPSHTFEATPSTRELVSFVAVRPRLSVPVAPDDFPLRRKTIGFRRGESVRRVTIRHALRPFSRRAPR